jgi:FdhD protein
MYHEIPCIKGDGSTFVSTVHPVVDEVSVSLSVNGRPILTAMTSPDTLEDFIKGFLFTEQIIKSLEEIESIKRDKNSFSVLTKNPFKVIGPKRLVLSGCGGTSTPLDVKRLPRISSTFTVSPSVISSAMKGVMDSTLHRLTGGVHVVGLGQGDTLLDIREDIGRHNALDKVIGYALVHSIVLADTFVISSGRISSEMVRKCLIANIPIIVSRGATTSLAVELAKQTGVCVVGFARGGKMNIYSHPERVQGAPSWVGGPDDVTGR